MTDLVRRTGTLHIRSLTPDLDLPEYTPYATNSPPTYSFKAHPDVPDGAFPPAFPPLPSPAPPCESPAVLAQRISPQPAAWPVAPPERPSRPPTRSWSAPAWTPASSASPASPGTPTPMPAATSAPAAAPSSAPTPAPTPLSAAAALSAIAVEHIRTALLQLGYTSSLADRISRITKDVYWAKAEAFHVLHTTGLGAEGCPPARPVDLLVDCPECQRQQQEIEDRIISQRESERAIERALQAEEDRERERELQAVRSAATAAMADAEGRGHNRDDIGRNRSSSSDASENRTRTGATDDRTVSGSGATATPISPVAARPLPPVPTRAATYPAPAAPKRPLPDVSNRRNSYVHSGYGSSDSSGHDIDTDSSSTVARTVADEQRATRSKSLADRQRAVVARARSVTTAAAAAARSHTNQGRALASKMLADQDRGLLGTADRRKSVPEAFVQPSDSNRDIESREWMGAKKDRTLPPNMLADIIAEQERVNAIKDREEQKRADRERAVASRMLVAHPQGLGAAMLADQERGLRKSIMRFGKRRSQG